MKSTDGFIYNCHPNSFLRNNVFRRNFVQNTLCHFTSFSCDGKVQTFYERSITPDVENVMYCSDFLKLNNMCNIIEKNIVFVEKNVILKSEKSQWSINTFANYGYNFQVMSSAHPDFPKRRRLFRRMCGPSNYDCTFELAKFPYNRWIHAIVSKVKFVQNYIRPISTVKMSNERSQSHRWANKCLRSLSYPDTLIRNSKTWI